jgi:LacI family transcriptional regulator, gluconate utilization system Gnt-I transcriptional repressor
MQRIKMQDVAKAAGVSTMTVSRALRRDGRIAPATRRRILKIVHDLGYVPDRTAASFSTRKSGFVGTLLPSLNNTHFADTAAGLQDALHPAGLQLLLGNTNYRKGLAEKLIETMLERRPEAMVITYDDHSPRARRLLTEAGIPIVEMWELPRRPIGHVVGFSNRRAGAAMTQHLIDLGRTRIAFIGEADDKGTRGAERRQGFEDALTAAGLDSQRQVSLARPPVGMMQGRAAMQQVLAHWPDTDAVMCVSDPCAYGALTACQLQGITVPDRVAIAGFGDFEISHCAVPSISTVSISSHDIGWQAGALVVDVLKLQAKGIIQAPRLISVDANPVIRDSTRAGGADHA